MIDVDAHLWRHTQRGEKYVTVIIDLTPIRDRNGPSRLLRMIEGRSKRVFKTGLVGQPQSWRERLEVVALDRLIAFNTAIAKVLPESTAILEPLHVARPAGDGLNRRERRARQDPYGHRSRAGDPPMPPGRALHTGDNPLTDRQRPHLTMLIDVDVQVQVKATWGIQHLVVETYLEPDRAWSEQAMAALADALRHRVPTPSPSDKPWAGHQPSGPPTSLPTSSDSYTSNNPTEAISGRREHFRDATLDLRNLTNYVAPCMFYARGLGSCPWPRPR